jgi:hypothetical protein
MAAPIETSWLSPNQIRQRIRRRREFVLAAMEAGELPFERRGRERFARLKDVEAWEANLTRRQTTKVLIHPDLAFLA